MGLGDNLLGFGGWDKGTWGLAKKHPSSIALVPFLELQAIQIWSYKRPNFGGTSDPSPFRGAPTKKRTRSKHDILSDP